MTRHTQRKRVFLTVTFFGAIMGLLLAGCTTATPPPQMGSFESGQAPELVLAAGDIIEIKFPYAVQFNETQTILPDGKITLPLVGEIKAAGKTPYELQKELFSIYTNHLQHPELNVIVRSLYERRAYVGGEVNRPGFVELPGRLTVLEAIIQAGGFDLEFAEPQNVILLRQNGEKREAYALDLKPAIKGEAYDPVYLEPKDVVYVPRTTVTNVRQWVNQHIYDLLPRVGLGFGYQLNPDDN